MLICFLTRTIVSGTDDAKEVNLDRYREVLHNSLAKDIITDKVHDLSSSLSIDARDVYILEMN